MLTQRTLPFAVEATPYWNHTVSVWLWMLCQNTAIKYLGHETLSACLCTVNHANRNKANEVRVKRWSKINSRVPQCNYCRKGSKDHDRWISRGVRQEFQRSFGNWFRHVWGNTPLIYWHLFVLAVILSHSCLRCKQRLGVTWCCQLAITGLVVCGHSWLMYTSGYYQSPRLCIIAWIIGYSIDLTQKNKPAFTDLALLYIN